MQEGGLNEGSGMGRVGESNEEKIGTTLITQQ